MLETAILGALPAVDAGPIDLQPRAVQPSRHEVGLAVEIWHPEAVNDVSRFQVDQDRTSGWQVQLVGGGDTERRLRMQVFDVPPPLITRHLYGERVRVWQ